MPWLNFSGRLSVSGGFSNIQDNGATGLWVGQWALPPHCSQRWSDILFAMCLLECLLVLYFHQYSAEISRITPNPALVHTCMKPNSLFSGHLTEEMCMILYLNKFQANKQTKTTTKPRKAHRVGFFKTQGGYQAFIGADLFVGGRNQQNYNKLSFSFGRGKWTQGLQQCLAGPILSL